MNTGTLLFNIYEPRGVIGAITPWNFPSVNAVLQIRPGPCGRNTMCSSLRNCHQARRSSLPNWRWQAGVPEGVLNVVPGLGATVGTALAIHPDVNMLTFTVRRRRAVKSWSCRGRSNGKPLLLECGGKSPELVFNDVNDLDAVADAVVQSVLGIKARCAARILV